LKVFVLVDNLTRQWRNSFERTFSETDSIQSLNQAFNFGDGVEKRSHPKMYSKLTFLHNFVKSTNNNFWQFYHLNVLEKWQL